MSNDDPSSDSKKHRQRMRARIEKHGAESLVDYEIIEVLLYHAIPRIDTKPHAKALLKKFGSLQSVFHANKADLLSVKGIGDNSANLIALVKNLSARIVQEDAFKKGPLLASWPAVTNYCRSEIGHRKTEVFMALYLDSSNRLISQDTFDTGTVNKVAVYPREIVRSALAHHAVAVIIVHNHPSDNTTPSKPDIAMTKTIMNALQTVDIALHDHMIIGKSSATSFKQLGLI